MFSVQSTVGLDPQGYCLKMSAEMMVVVVDSVRETFVKRRLSGHDERYMVRFDSLSDRIWSLIF